MSSATQEDAEDILQEVFIKAYQNLRGFDPSLKFSSWIYRITHNEVVSFWRKTQARPQVIHDEELLSAVASDKDFVEEFSRELDKETIQHVLSKLDKKYREVLVLKYLEQQSYDEMSDILQKPVGTIGTLINRAKKQFQTVAESHNVDFKDAI